MAEIFMGIVAVFVLGPFVGCALVGRSKGHKWYLFAPLGFLSLAGLIVADKLPPRGDEKWQTEPWGLFLGVPVGLVLGMVIPFALGVVLFPSGLGNAGFWIGLGGGLGYYLDKARTRDMMSSGRKLVRTLALGLLVALSCGTAFGLWGIVCDGIDAATGGTHCGAWVYGIPLLLVGSMAISTFRKRSAR